MKSNRGTPLQVTVRAAAPKDVAAIKYIGHESWPVTYSFAGRGYIDDGLARWWSDDAIRHSLQSTLTLVAEREGLVVGMGNIDLRSEPATIWKLYVLPDHQGGGVGHRLLESLLMEAESETHDVLLEYTDGNDGAAAFYHRHGFRELRRDPPEHPGWPEQVWMIHRRGRSRS